MKGTLFFSTLFFVISQAFGQFESVEPLSVNTDLSWGQNVKTKALSTFDSTFIYKSDTLSLPFFDEFSQNHFQKYTKDFSDPSVTSVKKYRIVSSITNLPITTSESFTSQVTFKRTYNVATDSYTDQNLIPVNYLLGDLSVYPVVYATTPMYPAYYIYDTIGGATSNSSDTVYITNPDYYQDSATQFFMNINNPSAYWLDDFAYHNYRFAINPRTLGVVTFDGLDQNGFPYAIGTAISNYADFLTSKPIDLSQNSASDSVYFSFLYQPKGFGDMPEMGDSLVLEFYAKDLNQWKRVWSTNGAPTDIFKVGHVRLENPIYFKKGFQFRFKNYGGLSGALDMFHLDYVHLRSQSGIQDTLFKDFAFSYPIGSLLKTYTSVPWDHYKNNPLGKMNDQVEITVHNGSNLTENNQNGQVKISYNNNVESTFTLNAQVLSGGNINYGPRTTYTSFHDFSNGYYFDPLKTGNAQNFKVLATAGAPFPNLAQNDSTFAQQVFYNYYSYDDGTAELAFGPTAAQARLAVKFDTYEQDSLLGIAIHFVPSVNDVSSKLFLLTVWENNGGVPGTVLYQDNIFFPRQPIYENERNQFTTYYFPDSVKVGVGTSFFIGWRQFDANRLNVGFDKNNDNSDKVYYSIDGGVNWINSTIEGSVMMRPIFSTALDNELTVDELLDDEHLAYPNPFDDNITFKSLNYSGVKIFTTSGQLILESTESQLNTSDLKSGVYFARLNGSTKVHKLIKN